MRREIVYIGYTGGLGGEAMQMFELASGAAAKGWQVTVVVPELEGLQKFIAAYRDRPNLTINTGVIRFDTGAQNPIDVLRLIGPYRNAPILHLHTGDICLPRMTLAMVDLLRPRNAFATIHSADVDMLPGSSRARYWRFVASRRFQKVICPSGHGKRTQATYGLPADRLATIYNGVDTERYASGDGTKIRQQLGLSPTTPLILFASRFHPQKRPVDAVQAFGKVARKRPDVHFAMVGVGPLDAEVRAAIRALPVGQDRVHLPGHQHNIPDWLAASTVWILPSLRENFSLAVIEALAAGCTVVSTHCQGNDEILENGKNALTAPVGNVDALAEALLCALSDDALRQRLSAEGRQTASRFTRERMVTQHLALYEEALAPQRKAGTP